MWSTKHFFTFHLTLCYQYVMISYLSGSKPLMQYCINSESS